MFLQNIFITETSNYTKTILHSHTDHYSNTRVKNYKPLTTEELKKSIVSHTSTAEKREPYAGMKKPTAALSLVP
jgi:UDP-galactopyranose mutase